MKVLRFLLFSVVFLTAFTASIEGHSQEKELQKFVKKFMKEMVNWDDISSFIHPEMAGYDTLVTDRILIHDYYLETYTDSSFTIRSKTTKYRDFCSRTTFQFAVVQGQYFIIPSAPDPNADKGWEKWYDPWVLHERLCETDEEKD